MGRVKDKEAKDRVGNMYVGSYEIKVNQVWWVIEVSSCWSNCGVVRKFGLVKALKVAFFFSIFYTLV